MNRWDAIAGRAEPSNSAGPSGWPGGPALPYLAVEWAVSIVFDMSKCLDTWPIRTGPVLGGGRPLGPQAPTVGDSLDCQRHNARHIKPARLAGAMAGGVEWG